MNCLVPAPHPAIDRRKIRVNRPPRTIGEEVAVLAEGCGASSRATALETAAKRRMAVGEDFGVANSASEGANPGVPGRELPRPSLWESGIELGPDVAATVA
jgi:hypothetical protein